MSQDTAALIRKATIAAHEALATLDGTLQEQIAELYAEAIEAIADQIMQAAAHGELGRIEALRGMMDYAVARLRAMQDAYGQLLDSALMEAARLGTEPYASAAVAGLNTAAVAAEAALFVKTFQAADGLQLSDRLWRLDAQASETMQNLLREAVLTGRDHERLAADILRDLHDRMTGPGSPLDNALRLARTEINRAHGEAYMMGGEKVDGFAGWRFLLSPAHPRPDICFRSGTPITTILGHVPIEHVRYGDVVLTHTGAWRRVLKLYRSRLVKGDALVRVTVKSELGELHQAVMTPNHPVRVAGGWIQAGDLQKGYPVSVASLSIHCHPSGDDTCGTESSNSHGSLTGMGLESTYAQECGELQGLLSIHSPRTDCLHSQEPTFLRTSASKNGLGSSPRHSSSGCLHPCESPKAVLEPLSYGGTCRGDAFRNLGCSLQPGRIADSNTFFHIQQEQTSSSMLDTSSFDTRQNSISVQASESEMFCRNGGIPSQSLSYILTGMVVSIEHLQSDGEIVYNLEVEHDHSYAAGSIVVHNCDLHARANLYGLGPGVYPDRARCPWPAHPNTLSYVEIVFEDEIDEDDRKGKTDPITWLKEQPRDVQEAVLGKHKADWLAEGKLKAADITTPWKELKDRED